MGKTFHYLAGLHRSGNTVLSSILNQHPEIYSSPLGPLCEYMWLVHKCDHEAVDTNTFKYRTKQMMVGMMESYYSDVEKPIILNRDKNWGHPYNLEMLKKYITEKPKIIYTVRPIAEVLASLMAINPEGIAKDMDQMGWDHNAQLSDEENICEYLMDPDSQIMRGVRSAYSMSQPENAGIFHIVRYEDLLTSPQKTMDGIYDFLEVESFEHDFNNIEKNEEYDEQSRGLSKDLHKVRKQLSRSNLDVDKYVPKSIQEKYAYIDGFFK